MLPPKLMEINVLTGVATIAWNEPLRMSPVPTAFVPVAKSDSNTLPSVPTTEPSPKPTIAGVPLMLIMIVAVDLSPSLSVTS